MAEHTSRQAREGLVSSLKGKAKEAAGAVTGNDSLAAEGQLEQSEADARRQANARDAVADAEQAEAQRRVSEQRQAAAEERQAADREASIEKAQARHDAMVRERAADLAADRDRETGEAIAEQQAAERISDARGEAVLTAEQARQQEEDARSDHDAAQASAAAAQRAAERAREDAHRVYPGGAGGQPGQTP